MPRMHLHFPWPTLSASTKPMWVAPTDNIWPKSNDEYIHHWLITCNEQISRPKDAMHILVPWLTYPKNRTLFSNMLSFSTLHSPLTWIQKRFLSLHEVIATYICRAGINVQHNRTYFCLGNNTLASSPPFQIMLRADEKRRLSSHFVKRNEGIFYVSVYCICVWFNLHL